MKKTTAMSVSLAISLVPFLSVSVAGQTVAPAADSPPAAADPSPAPDEGRKDYAQISLEELLNKDITVAATKTRVDVAKAPVSVTVVTPDDIRRSGATNLGDLLRTIPGLDVLQSFPSYTTVSARGTSEAFLNNMLVLIDGRRLETQLAGTPFLEEAPVRLEDIKRIEVVRGPVGALYGTNALAGVISITTYSPDEVAGTFVSVLGGNRDTYQAFVRHAGTLSSGWGYKVTGGYSYSGTWASMDEADTLPPIAMRKADVVALLEGRIRDDGRLVLEAGFSKGDLASLTVVTNQTQYYTYPHLRIGYTRPQFHAQLTYNPQALELRERVPPIQPLFDQWSHALNLAVDRSVAPFSGSTLTLGGNLRYQRSEFTTIVTPHDQVVGSVFVQNEQSIIANRLTIFGALGLSHHPEIDAQLDGNAAIVATPVENHTLRVSFGRGHRDPSFNENYNSFSRLVGPNTLYIAGRTDLQPENIQAWEVGYRGRFSLSGSSRVILLADAFQEKLRDLIGTRTTPVRAGSVPQSPAATLLQEFVNLDARDGRGFEVGAELDSSAVRLVGHYSYQDFETVATGAEILADIPKHKVAAGVGTQRGRLEMDVWVHAVSSSIDPSVDPGDHSYVLVNPRVGVKAGRWMFSLQAFNALNDKHLETANARRVKGETIRRSVTFGVRYMP
jgi:outer membrane receptor protein involved in Fe transport